MAAGLWLAAIFLLTLWPKPPEILSDLPGIPGADKASHALLYAVEGWLLVRASPRPPGATLGRLVLRVALFLAVVALVNEGLQTFVPPRTPEWGDFVADVAGGALGAWVASRRQVSSR